ncbi:hypothetical protein ACQPW3_01145 [Actinosynnema sp. CA-248983]
MLLAAPGGTWPALLHRLATSWAALLRLLVGLLPAAAVVVGLLPAAAVVVGARRVAGDVVIHIGPFGVVHRVVEPAEVKPLVVVPGGVHQPGQGPGVDGPGHRRRGTDTRSRSAATTSSPSYTSAASARNSSGSV